MKKVLFVMNTMGRAGAEMALLELLRNLNKEELEISLFVLTGQGEMKKEIPEGVRLLNSVYDECSVHTAEGKRRLSKTVLKAMLRRGTVFRLLPYLIDQTVQMIKNGKFLPDKLLWRVLSDGAERFEERYDLAVAYIEGGSTYYVLDHVNAEKKVAFFHVDYRENGNTRSLDRECYLQFDRIFAVSDTVKESLCEIYPECREKTEVFHSLVNKDRIKQMAEVSGGFSDEYSGYRIVTVGRLTTQKDFAQSVYAMKLLKDQGLDARWYVFGEGEQRAELERIIREQKLEDRFFLPGVVENPYCYMKQADIYVHATRFEGKSIAIQEAQVLGRPILASACSGNKELVQHGTDGLLCDMTPEAICEGIKELLFSEEKRREFGEMAAKRRTTDSREIEKLMSIL